jgi:sugar (pentulose or hexulose) kinase
MNISTNILPKVVISGDIIGTISTKMAQYFSFNPDLLICAGTTDSTAAIIASGAHRVGDAVTSLGSTLVMKILTKQAIFDQKSGIYSQPLGNLWLVGGSSNSGGEVFKQFFNTEEVSALTTQLTDKINQHQFALLNLNYYPLSAQGERFPLHDPYLQPRLLPRPKHKIDFFQAILEGMADIEQQAYQKLADVTHFYPKRVISMGRGSLNFAWRYIREQKLAIPVTLARQQQAAIGSALLAQKNSN